MVNYFEILVVLPCQFHFPNLLDVHEGRSIQLINERILFQLIAISFQKLHFLPYKRKIFKKRCSKANQTGLGNPCDNLLLKLALGLTIKSHGLKRHRQKKKISPHFSSHPHVPHPLKLSEGYKVTTQTAPFLAILNQWIERQCFLDCVQGWAQCQFASGKGHLESLDTFHLFNR